MHVKNYDHLNDLVQDWSNSTVNTLELQQFCNKPAIVYIDSIGVHYHKY